MIRRLSVWLLAIPVLLAVGRGGMADDAEDRASAYRLHLPGTQPENVMAVRVLGLSDGRLVPVEGARVTGWSEPASDVEVEPSQLLAEGTSDAHGFVNLTWSPEGERPFHWLAEAPGKAVRTIDGRSGDVFLARGAPYALEVLGPMGEPLPDARVEYYIYGCPHSPSARVGTTDAEGNLVFEGLPVADAENPDAHNEWGQFWIVKEGVGSRRYYAPPRRADGAPAVLLTDPGRSASGVVLGEDSRPMAGIVVRQHGYPRGPATTTDAEGRFRLSGLDASAQVLAVYDPRDLLPEGPNAVVEDFEPDVPLRLTLRRGRASALGQEEARDAVDVVVMRRYSTAAPPALWSDLPVRLVRLADGLVAAGETGDPSTGLFRPLLPPGRYRVIVGGGFSPVVRATDEIDLPSATPLRFVLDSAPTLLLRGLEYPDPEWVVLRLPGGWEGATDRGGHSLHLPPDAPAVIQIDRGRPVILPVGACEDGFRMATVPAPDPALVCFRLASADPDWPLDDVGVHADDWGEGTPEPEEDETGQWIWSTYGRGTRRMNVRSKGFQERTIEVILAPDVREVDLGEIRLHPLRPRTLRVLHADGTPVRDLVLRWGIRGEHGNELADDDGTFALELGPRPAPAVLRGEGIYPRPIRLSTEGPAEVRLPGGHLVIHVRDTEGRSVESVAYVDHVSVLGEEGDHTLRGVPPGVHTVIVGARDHVGAVREVEVGEDESKTIEFALPKR